MRVEPNYAKCELATAKLTREPDKHRPTPAKAPRQLLCGISGGLLPLSPIMSWLGWVLGVFRGRGLHKWGPIVEIPTAFATFDGPQAKFPALVHFLVRWFWAQRVVLWPPSAGVVGVSASFGPGGPLGVLGVLGGQCFGSGGAPGA